MLGKDFRFIAIAFVFITSASQLSARTFHLDAAGGKDTNDGLTPATAWLTLAKASAQELGPGDSVLFRRGQTWTGSFTVKGSGAEGRPIVVSAFGTGPRPILDGKGAVDRVISLENREFVELRNLEITNPSATEGSRLGIYVNAVGGVRRHIHIVNCHIHHVMGRYAFTFAGKNTGGIGFFLGAGGRYDGILIDSCEVGHIVRVGIFTKSETNSERGNRFIRNFTLRNSSIHHCAGDGLILRHADSAMVERNVAYENHNGPEDKVEYGVALWTTNSDRTTFQYNEVYNTRGKMDGQAFDADMAGTYGTLIQYNYTHGNEGGFMLVYGQSHDAIVRYNISQDDGRLGLHIFDFPVWTSPRGSGIFHNNTIYLGPGNKAVLADEALMTGKFYNNIVINQGGAKLYVPSGGEHAVIQNNNLFGYAAPDLAAVPGNFSFDPLLVAAGTGSLGFASLQGYRLSRGSPGIGRGIGTAAMAGNYWAANIGTVDFWGNRINPARIDLGAHQFSSPDYDPNQVGVREWARAPEPSNRIPSRRGWFWVNRRMVDLAGRIRPSSR